MSCILSIVGQNLDIDAFIIKSKLEPFQKFYKGEPRIRTKSGGSKNSFSGLSITTSDADFNNVTAQIKDFIKFLKENKEKLKHILTTKEVERATLDFGIELKIDMKNVCYQFKRFPYELIKLAGELGWELRFLSIQLQ